MVGFPVPARVLDSSTQTRDLANLSKGKDLSAALTPAKMAPTEGTAPLCTEPAFVAGFLFAGRYRMVAPLGRMEAGTVWQAHDLVLKTDVALKIIPSLSGQSRERILAEVRLTRRITHPAIRRIFDVGEADGALFCSMELVRGEDLARLLRRVGRVPSERVAEIGEELCEGLAAAHAQGVVHGDLRLESVLVDERGSIRLIDFALPAALQTDSPAGRRRKYEAPELRSPGAVPTVASDLYSAGGVLYELVVGQPPVGDRPPKPSSITDDVSGQLERVIMRALQPDPWRRPMSATAMAEQLTLRAPAALNAGWRPWFAGGALTLAVIIVAGVIAWLPPIGRQRGAAVLTDDDTIVIADFVNTTEERVFDGSLNVAIAVALEQSPFLKVLADERARETLLLMQRAPREPITRATALEIARREGLKAVVTGSIGKHRGLYIVAVEAVDTDSGGVVAREQAQAQNKERVLTALGEVTARLRSRLGESLALVRRFDAPLPQATTASLEALHAYALALDQGRVNPRAEAIPHLRRALELDPNFALAHASLSGAYRNTGRFVEAPAHSRKAFELRHRVSERERYVITWRYYIDAEQAWDNALELAQSWTATYPREAFAFNSLGVASAALGNHERAVAAFRDAIRLDARFVPPFPNLAGSLIALNRFDEAKAVVAEATRQGISSNGLRRAGYVLAFLSGDAAEMTRQLSATRATPDAVWSPTWQARAATATGRFRAAHHLFQEGARAAIEADLRDLAAQWTMEDAEAHAIIGQCEEAAREANEGLDLARDNFTLERAARTFALCDSADRVAALSAELSMRFQDATLTRRIQIPVADAALALRRNDAPRAAMLLNSVKPLDLAPAAELWPAYLRADAELRRRNAGGAVEGFDEIVAHRGVAPTSPLYALAHLGLARASALAGDLDRAKGAYQTFLTLWAEADADLRAMTDARREYARIK